jgi:hypothetical protein
MSPTTRRWESGESGRAGERVRAGVRRQQIQRTFVGGVVEFLFQGGKDVGHDVAQSDDHANAVSDQIAPVPVNKASAQVISVTVSQASASTW